MEYFTPILGLGLTGVFSAVFIFVVLLLVATRIRIVVGTNDVDIVQRGKGTTSYGRGEPAGNVYYNIPPWIPKWGIRVTHLPISNFSHQLLEYAAYDIGRVPFIIDIIGFFRISDSGVAASRVVNFEDLKKQLDFVMKGAMRSILASHDIEEILQGRGSFSEKFTEAVKAQLQEWGLTPVKNVELMDIRDAKDSEVIANIMRKKSSLIAMQSRVAVAENDKTATNAETEAGQMIAIRKVEAQQYVGQRNAEQEKAVGIAKQQAEQAIQIEAAVTAQKRMEVTRVNQVRQAEIDKERNTVAAEQQKAVVVIEAQGTQQSTIAIAEGELEKAKRNAEAVRLQGEAKGKALTAEQMATVNPQIELNNSIGANEGYQKFLLGQRQIDANKEVGIAQAEALKAAGIKIIANTATPMEGVKSVMDLLTPRGAMQIGQALETLKETDVGKTLLNTISGTDGAEKPRSGPRERGV